MLSSPSGCPAERHIAYVPCFPLSSFLPLQSDVLEWVAKRLGATPMAVASPGRYNTRRTKC